MELWMKIALVAMAVMSIMGLTAFIIVLRHAIPRVEKLESFEENFNDKIDGIHERFACDEQAVDSIRSRIESLLHRVNEIEYHKLLDIEVKMNRQKKRIKALEKKEG